MAAYNWDSTIEKDGGDFKLLPPGIYPFTIKAIEKGYYNGGANISACPKANLTLRVGVGADAADVTEGLLLEDSLEWKLCQFFLAIGDRKHGEALQMNWEESHLIGKTGWVEIDHREYTNKEGETKKANQVVRFVDPLDAPANGQPQIKKETAPAQADSSAW